MTQNKVIPGAYINFVSAERAQANLSERGVAALPLALDWGETGGVIEIRRADFESDAVKLLGYRATDEKLRPVREVLMNARVLYLCRLGTGEKAACEAASARWPGGRGNDLTVVVRQNVDEEGKMDVITLLAGEQVDCQTVERAEQLSHNAFLVWNREWTLTPTAGTPLTGGESPEVTGGDYEDALGRLEPYAFHALGCLSREETVQRLFAAFTRRMRDEAGAKFQTVLYRYPADYEGVISVENRAADAPEPALVAWVTGAEAGCGIGRDLTNRKYDGEYAVDTLYTQSALEKALRGGKLLFHRVGGDVRLLRDINSLVGFTPEKGEDFSSNQTVRVLDQIGNDIAALFQKRFLGVTPNDAAGRVSLWSAIVAHHRELERLRAIEDFKPDDILVEKGESKSAVVVTDRVTPVNCMQQLYMTVVVA